MGSTPVASQSDPSMFAALGLRLDHLSIHEVVPMKPFSSSPSVGVPGVCWTLGMPVAGTPTSPTPW